MSGLIYLGKDVPDNRCKNIRGGPRSQVFCEKDKGHSGEHYGRGEIGQMFFWVGWENE